MKIGFCTNNISLTNHTNIKYEEEGILKRLLIGIALGMATGIVVGNMPEVKSLVNKGKKKVNQMTK